MKGNVSRQNMENNHQRSITTDNTPKNGKSLAKLKNVYGIRDGQAELLLLSCKQTVVFGKEIPTQTLPVYYPFKACF